MWSAIIKALEAPIDEAMRKETQGIASRGASPATPTSAAARKKKVLKHQERRSGDCGLINQLSGTRGNTG